MKYLTISEYAAIWGVSVHNVRKHIHAGNKLPKVRQVKKFSKFFLLGVDNSLSAKDFPKGRFYAARLQK